MQTHSIRQQRGIRIVLAPCLALLSLTAIASAAQQNSMPNYCGSPDFKQIGSVLLSAPSDCGMNSNTTGPSYDPSYIMEIPVVWHVISNTSGNGDVPTQNIINQMAHMNASYGATLGSNGTNSRIRFVLASVDPLGQPTTGIERVTNNTWFNDSGNYTSLTWDSNLYLNIFTLSPQFGAIGYVTNLPQGGIVGSPGDAVRMLHSAIDSNQFPHVVSHEIGHYMGLYHTFEGCANSNCQTDGDLICDTSPHSQPTQFCSGTGGSCAGLPVPRNNFMNYQDVACVWEFTPGQIRRMRCSLENWRPNLWSSVAIGTNYCTSAVNSSGAAAMISASGSTSVNLNDVQLSAGPQPNSYGIFFYGAQQTSTPFGNGTLCVGGALFRLAPHQASNGTLIHQLDLSNPSSGGPQLLAGSTWFFQAWFRDNPAGGSQFDLSDGLGITFVP